ncbi:MAG TPA: TIGR02186 family protein [Devosia sp.]|nr:TIGR02186 family protein [Devosia sp.]
MTRAFLVAVALLLAALPARAEKLASTVSSATVQITSSFEGTTLSLFGTIEPDIFGMPLIGPYNVIVVVTGPLQDRVTRLKTNSWGIWTNTDQVVFRQFPSFYNVLASGKLDLIASPEVLDGQNILPIAQAEAASTEGATPKATRFGTELVRLMTQQAHFAVREDAVRFLSDTAYVAQVTLPSDVTNGPFLAHTYVLKDRRVVAEHTEGFSVRKAGFENFVFVASRQQPLLYGIACVILALGTGWLAGVVFRR